MPVFDLLAQAPLVPIQEARSREDLDAEAAELRRSPDWNPDGRPIVEVRGEVDPGFIHHAEHYQRMMHGGTRPDGSTYGGGGGLSSVRMMAEDATAEIVISGSREWDPSAHAYLTRVRFANYGLIGRQAKMTWTERARLLLRDDVRVHCSCPAYKYYHQHAATEKGFALEAEDRAATTRNPEDRGGVCKHLEHTLRYIAANYTTIAGAMKRHRQTEESTVNDFREPPVQNILDRLEAELGIAPLVESEAVKTNEVPKVRYNFQRSNYSKKEHGEVDKAFRFFVGPDGKEVVHGEGDPAPAEIATGGYKPATERVYGTDAPFGQRTTRMGIKRKGELGGALQRQTRKGKKGELYLDKGYMAYKVDKFGQQQSAGLKVLGEETTIAEPMMSRVFKAAVKNDPALAERLAKDTADVGRPAVGNDWWQHPTVKHFLSTYDPTAHTDSTHGIVDPAGKRHPIKGLATHLTNEWQADYDVRNPDYQKAVKLHHKIRDTGYVAHPADVVRMKSVMGDHKSEYERMVPQFNEAHLAVQRALHQLVKDPRVAGKKSIIPSSSEDKVDVDAVRAPDAGRRDPNWDREDYEGWVKVKQYLKSDGGASTVLSSAIPKPGGTIADAMVAGLTHTLVREPTEPDAEGNRKMKVKHDEAGAPLVVPKEDAKGEWNKDVYNLRGPRQLYRPKARTVYGKNEKGDRVLMSVDIDMNAAVKPRDYEFAKSKEVDSKGIPYPANADELARRKWLDDVGKQQKARREAASAARKARAGDLPIDANELSKLFGDAPLDPSTTPAVAPTDAATPAAAPTSHEPEFKLIKGKAPIVQHRTGSLLGRRQAKKLTSLASLAGLEGFGNMQFPDTPKPAVVPTASPAPKKAGAPAQPQLARPVGADSPHGAAEDEINRLHADMLKSHQEAYDKVHNAHIKTAPWEVERFNRENPRPTRKHAETAYHKQKNQAVFSEVSRIHDAMLQKHREEYAKANPINIRAPAGAGPVEPPEDFEAAHAKIARAADRGIIDAGTADLEHAKIELRKKAATSVVTVATPSYESDPAFIKSRPTRADAEDEYVARKLRAKIGIPVHESIRSIIKLSSLCEGLSVSQDITAAIEAAIEKASRAGMARTANSLKMIRRNIGIEGGSLPPADPNMSRPSALSGSLPASGTPADPRGLAIGGR